MPWLIVALGYLLGCIPTAYIAGRLTTGRDIRQLGDGNMGTQNAFREVGAQQVNHNILCTGRVFSEPA